METKQRKSRNRLVYECYMDMKNDKSFRKYSKVVRDEALKMIHEDYRKKYGDEAYKRLMAEIEADNKRLRAGLELNNA